MKTKFTTQCDLEKLSDIRRFLHRVLAELEVAEPVKQEIILAVDEACANAIIHGNQADKSQKLQLEVERLDDRLTVEISDVGNFRDDLAHHEDQNIDELIASRHRGGLGLKLIYTIMDQVQYYTRDTRNICSLTKRLNQPEQ
jgi:serine/threonine-protein kinase RsbW